MKPSQRAPAFKRHHHHHPPLSGRTGHGRQTRRPCAKASLFHFHTLTFTLTISLSRFHFLTFTFSLSGRTGHGRQAKRLCAKSSLFHFHTFTFTISLSHFHFLNQWTYWPWETNQETLCKILPLFTSVRFPPSSMESSSMKSSSMESSSNFFFFHQRLCVYLDHCGHRFGQVGKQWNAVVFVEDHEVTASDQG